MASYHDIIIADQSRALFGDYHIHQYIEVRFDEVERTIISGKKRTARPIAYKKRSGRHNEQDKRKCADHILDRLERYVDRELYSVYRHQPCTTTSLSKNPTPIKARDTLVAVAERLYSSITGSPKQSFENSRFFHPEAFTNQIPAHALSVAAIKTVQNQPGSLQYFIAFHRDSRRLQRVIVQATFETSDGVLLAPQTAIRGTGDPIHRALPESLHTAMETLLNQAPHTGQVIRVSVQFTTVLDRWVVSDTGRVRTMVDPQEHASFEHERILRYCRHLGCEVFDESDIVVLRRVMCYRHVVLARGTLLEERKVPFVSDGRSDDNFLDEFVRKLKSLAVLRGCDGIIQLRGLVVDRNRRYLKGYLCEMPVVYNLRFPMGMAKCLGIVIPWPIREQWIRDIIAAIVKTHERAITVGVVSMHHIGIREDGTTILKIADANNTRFGSDFDRIPDEVPEGMNTGSVSKEHLIKANFESDILQLGRVIWLIAQHRPHFVGLQCAMAACTTVPRYQCYLPHRALAELPEVYDPEVPAYIRDIIRVTRSSDPNEPPTAKSLWNMLPVSKTGPRLRLDGQLLEALKDLDDAQTPFCDECGDLINNCYYHCQECAEDDFDLCLGCYDVLGIRCWKPLQHCMVKRRLQKRSEISAF